MKLFKCERCSDGPCVRSENIDHDCIGTSSTEDWKMVNMIQAPKHESMAINPDNLEFGDDVEVLFDLEYRLARWCGVLGVSRNRAAVLVSDVVWTFPLKHVRLPLKKLMRRGQPILVECGTLLKVFDKFNELGNVLCFDNMRNTSEWTKFRLLSKKELEKIGQDGLGWLTSD